LFEKWVKKSTIKMKENELPTLLSDSELNLGFVDEDVVDVSFHKYMVKLAQNGSDL
jgi:hypothetical protein